MGFYSERIFPYCLEWSMSEPLFEQYRQQVLAEVSGTVLEIGFGTGLNLPHYPSTVDRIVTVDPNPGVNRIAQKRIEASTIEVQHLLLGGEKLPLDDRTFDSAVSTWTLCSIPKVEQAIAEIYRVLKPGGNFFFVEHGLSEQPQIRVWQNRLTPIQKRIADGCHLNRNIQQLVEQYFPKVEVKRFYSPKVPKILGYFYQGIATKEST